VSHNIVRQVNLDRESSRYCPNLSDHCHFQDEASGKIHDVVFKEGVKLEDILELPKGNRNQPPRHKSEREFREQINFT